MPAPRGLESGHAGTCEPRRCSRDHRQWSTGPSPLRSQGPRDRVDSKPLLTGCADSCSRFARVRSPCRSLQFSSRVGVSDHLDGVSRGCGCTQGVVPFAMPVVPDEDAVGFEGAYLLVGDLHPGGVIVPVEFGVHGQPCRGRGRGRGEGVHDHVVAGQWPALPVHRDVGEQAVLDRVPLAGSRRQVTDRDGQAGVGGEGCEFGLPRPGAEAVGAATVCGDQQP